MGARTELRQLRAMAQAYRSPSRWARQYRVIQRMEPTGVRRRRRVPGEVWAVTVVRDEADVIGLTIPHLLSQGVSRVLVADNGSTDGTYELLQRLARETRRVRVVRDREPAHYQSEKITWLAHQAWKGGADWVIPFDADEFWFAQGASLADFLSSQDPYVTRIYASFFHMVPTTAAPEDLLSAELMVDSTASFPGKIAVRSHPLIEIIPGNHDATRIGHAMDGLNIAHVQYRSPAQIARKVRQGTQAAQQTGEDLTWFSPHWASGAQLSDTDIQDVWENISHGRPDERIQFAARGPMVRLHPLRWDTWDPNGELDTARQQGA